MKKNGILFMDFATGRQREGASPEAAIRGGLCGGYRPTIMITTFAANLGVTAPIAIGSGAGSSSRMPLGVAFFDACS